MKRTEQQGPIPLVRPYMPDPSFVDFFRDNYTLGVWTNFGPLFEECVVALRYATGGRECLPVTSGTTAIQLAVKTLLKEGSIVAVPDFTHSGTILGVKAGGCEPVIFGCDTESWCIDLELLYQQASQLDAVIVVSPFGYQVDFERYEAFSRETGVQLIYDLAGAWGMFPETQWPTCYSFHATKNFSVGEGGMVTFASKIQWELAQRISNFGTLPDRNISGLQGGNLKVDEVRCAMILQQLRALPEIEYRIRRKRAALDVYQNRLSEFCIPRNYKWYGQPSLCVLGGLQHAAAIEEQAKRRGIVCKKYYPLLSRMPALSSVKRVEEEPRWFFDTCIALPSDVTFQELERVVETVIMVSHGS